MDNSIPPLIPEIRRHSRALVRELDVIKGVFQDTGYTYSQCHALFELQQHGQLNTGELADILRLDKSTSSRLLNSMLEAGLVVAESNPDDQRQKFYCLTEKGRQATQCNNQLANEQVTGALALLDENEQGIVLRGMQLYAKALRHSRQQKEYKLRPIEQKDNEVVARIIREVMTEYGTVGEGYSIMDPEVGHMYEAYQGNKAAFFVIDRAGKVFGCGGIGPLAKADDGVCELKKMYFLPELRGMGWGKRLARHCLEVAGQLGYQTCYLETVERMWQANKLYQRLGFQRLEQPIGHTGHSGCEAYYAKKLN